jgi:integrase
MVQVLLGLRSSEVLNLRKRDLDCGGKVLVIEGTKTANAKRTLELDAPIVRDLLMQRGEGLAADAFIFGLPGATKVLSTTVPWKALARFCRLAGAKRRSAFAARPALNARREGRCNFGAPCVRLEASDIARFLMRSLALRF